MLNLIQYNSVDILLLSMYNVTVCTDVEIDFVPNYMSGVTRPHRGDA